MSARVPPGSSQSPGLAYAWHLEMRRNVAEEPGQNGQEPERPAAKRQKVPLEVQEQKLTPRPSSWPIALALTLVIAFIGVMIVNVTPILLGVGVVLVIVAIIGWMVEKH
jgi:hypothetical protein